VWDDVIKATSNPSGRKMSVGEHKFQFHGGRHSVGWTSAGQVAHAQKPSIASRKPSAEVTASALPEVLCIQKVGEFVELSKWVSKWGQNGELDGKVLTDVGTTRHSCFRGRFDCSFKGMKILLIIRSIASVVHEHSCGLD